MVDNLFFMGIPEGRFYVTKFLVLVEDSGMWSGLLINNVIR